MTNRALALPAGAQYSRSVDAVVHEEGMDNSLSSLELFVRTRDEQVFRTLYRIHTPRMFSLALRLVGGNQHDAEDIVQDAWSRACRLLSQFRGDSQLSTWLCGIVVNCFRELRRQNWEEAGEIPEQTAPSTSSSDLEQLVRRLPERSRVVLVLHDIEGYTHGEIAHTLGIAEGTSKHHLFRARRCLAEWLTAPSAKENKNDPR
jgi:RNA polymerase sigma-70 factor, ECF subfamily